MVQGRERHRLRIDEMSLGPYGVGRLEGKALLVADTAPGDLVEVSIASNRRDYAVAHLEAVIQAGPARRRPPCPFLPRCGGCDWQQIAYPEQVAAKGRAIAAQLGHALGLKLDPYGLVVPAPAEFGYRSRLRLKVRGNGAVGFFELGSNRMVEIGRCLLAGELTSLEAASQLAVAMAGRCDEIEIVKAGQRQVLVAHLRNRVQAADARRAGGVMASNAMVAGIILRGGGERVAIGEPVVSLDMEPGLQLIAQADAFSQVNHEQNRALIASVMEQSAIESGSSVLDLFCGAGNFSLPAARRGAGVMGVDADALAVGAAQSNAARLGLADARFIAMQAQEIAPFLLRAGYRPRIVILDPPRSGAKELMETIVKLEAARVLYVSCDVSTLARDLLMLTQGGYAVSSVKAFDFFPNTHHCEILALLT
jgi:23S rRNA (uracil1939-C5)-methyltransferase